MPAFIAEIPGWAEVIVIPCLVPGPVSESNLHYSYAPLESTPDDTSGC